MTFLNSEEARKEAEAGDNEMSPCIISLKPEIDFRARYRVSMTLAFMARQLRTSRNSRIRAGWFRTTKEHYYIYAQTMGGKTQYGIGGWRSCRGLFERRYQEA